MKFLPLLMLAVLTLPSRADDTLRARAALALASSKPVLSTAEANARAALALAPHRPVAMAPDLTKPLTMEQGLRLAREGRVVMVSVGMDCSSLCSTLRPDIPSVHAADWYGDTSPQLRLITAKADGTLWAQLQPWRGVPSEAEVRAIAGRLRCEATGCTCTGGCRCADKSDCPGRCPTAAAVRPAWTAAPGVCIGSR